MRYSYRSTTTIPTFASSAASNSRVFASDVRCYGLPSKYLFIVVCCSPDRLFIVIVTNWSHLSFDEEIWLSILIILISTRSSNKVIFAIFFLSQTNCVFSRSGISIIVIYSLKRLHLRCLLSGVFIFGIRNSLDLIKLLLWLNSSLILLRMLVWQTFVIFQLLKLFLQVLGDQLKLFGFGLLSVLVANSSDDTESIYKFIERKTIILRRFWDIHSFSGARSVVVLLPKLFIFENNLF